MSIVKNGKPECTLNKLVYIEINGYDDPAYESEKLLVQLLDTFSSVDKFLNTLSTVVTPQTDANEYRLSLINKYIRDGQRRVKLLTLRRVYLSNGFLREFEYYPIPDVRLTGTALVNRFKTRVKRREELDTPLFDVSYFYDKDNAGDIYVYVQLKTTLSRRAIYSLECRASLRIVCLLIPLLNCIPSKPDGSCLFSKTAYEISLDGVFADEDIAETAKNKNKKLKTHLFVINIIASDTRETCC